MRTRHALSTRLGVLALALYTAGPAMAGIPGDYVIDRMPECDIAAEGQICRQTVPNGHFQGLPDDRFRHGPPSLVGHNKTHPFGAHLQPWVFTGPSSQLYLNMPAVFERRGERAYVLTLGLSGDRAYQAVTLPAADQDDFIYTVHAHMGTDGDEARVKVQALFGDEDKWWGQTTKTQRVKGDRGSTGAPLGEMVRSVAVKAGSKLRRIAISFEHVSGVPVYVGSVEIVRSIPGQIPVEPVNRP